MAVTSATTPKAPTTPSSPTPRPPQGGSSAPSPAPGPQDSVSLSTGASKGGDGKSTTGTAPSRTSPVDRNEQDAHVADQQRDLEDRKSAGEDTDALRPATGDDADRYNGLVAEADSLEPGTHETDRGRVEVSEENGVKTLRYDEDGTQRIVTVDSNTGAASERVNRGFGNGQQISTESVEYRRAGDLLGPVVDRSLDRQLQEQQTQAGQALDQQILNAQLQAQQQRYSYAGASRQPSFGDYLRG